MKQKYLLWVVGLVVLWSISWLWVQAADNIDVDSFNFTVPTFRSIFLKLQWSDLQTEGVRLDAGGLYVAQEALLPWTAGNTMKIGSDGKVVRSLLQSNDIGDNAIGSNNIANGAVQNVDVGNLQITNYHIENYSLSANLFSPEINFAGSWLFYYTNSACEGTNGITAIVDGNIVCSPLPTLGSGGNGPWCLEWQTPVMWVDGWWECVAMLLGSTGDGDMYWDWTTTGFIWNVNSGSNVWVGLTQPTETLQAEQDVRVDANNGNNVGEVYCSKTDTWVSSSVYDIASCAICENEWFVYNPTSNMCEKVACTSSSPLENQTLVNGACGSSNGGSFATTPNQNLCIAGTPATPALSSNQTTWLWSCNGVNGGTSSACAATNSATQTTTNWVCGSANGTTVNTTPTINLCADGTATTVAWNGPWSWSCNGLNGWSNASCSANKTAAIVNWVCGSANNTPTSTTPTTNLCAAGSASSVAWAGTTNGDSSWNWSCNGLNGWSNASCGATSAQSQNNSYTYSWDIGAWSPCNTTSSCQGTYTSPGACGYVWQTVVWSIWPGNEQPGPYEGMLCRSFTSQLACNRGWLTHSCSWNINSFSTNSCVWVPADRCGTMAPYTSCSLSSAWATQLRTVVCRNNLGNIVADSLCSQPKPTTSQPCTGGGTAWSCVADTTTAMWCFIAETKITLADGSTKNIEDIKVGDKLKAVKGSNTVIALIRPTLGNQDIYAFNNQKAFFTANHPFLTTNGWKSLDPLTTKKEIPDLDVSLLSIWDTIISQNGNITVKSIQAKKSPTSTQLYNFQLDWDHTYFANGLAVHNKYEPGTPEQRIGQACTYNSQCHATVWWVYLACDNDTKTCQLIWDAAPNYVGDGCTWWTAWELDPDFAGRFYYNPATKAWVK